MSSQSWPLNALTGPRWYTANAGFTRLNERGRLQNLTGGQLYAITAHHIPFLVASHDSTCLGTCRFSLGGAFVLAAYRDGYRSERLKRVFAEADEDDDRRQGAFSSSRYLESAAETAVPYQSEYPGVPDTRLQRPWEEMEEICAWQFFREDGERAPRRIEQEGEATEAADAAAAPQKSAAAKKSAAASKKKTKESGKRPADTAKDKRPAKKVKAVLHDAVSPPKSRKGCPRTTLTAQRAGQLHTGNPERIGHSDQHVPEVIEVITSPPAVAAEEHDEDIAASPASSLSSPESEEGAVPTVEPLQTPTPDASVSSGQGPATRRMTRRRLGSS